jgi:hypothetical protein
MNIYSDSAQGSSALLGCCFFGHVGTALKQVTQQASARQVLQRFPIEAKTCMRLWPYAALLLLLLL